MAINPSTILSIIAVLTSIISLVIVLRQTLILKHANALPILIDMLREYRSADFKRHYRYIADDLRKECDPEQTGYTNLPVTAAIHVLPVSHFFDNLGLLVAHGIINEELVLSFMGESIEFAWLVLEPYIVKEGELRKAIREGELKKADYQEFFRDLVKRVRTNPPAQIRQKLLKPGKLRRVTRYLMGKG